MGRPPSLPVNTLPFAPACHHSSCCCLKSLSQSATDTLGPKLELSIADLGRTTGPHLMLSCLAFLCYRLSRKTSNRRDDVHLCVQVLDVKEQPVIAVMCFGLESQLAQGSKVRPDHWCTHAVMQ